MYVFASLIERVNVSQEYDFEIKMKSFFVLSLFVAVAIALEKPEDDNKAVRVTIEVRSFKFHDAH
jgi:hypothetical protein